MDGSVIIGIYKIVRYVGIIFGGDVFICDRLVIIKNSLFVGCYGEISCIESIGGYLYGGGFVSCEVVVCVLCWMSEVIIICYLERVVFGFCVCVLGKSYVMNSEVIYCWECM